MLSIFTIIKNVQIFLAIIKLFCCGILRKYCVVAVYKKSLGAVVETDRGSVIKSSTINCRSIVHLLVHCANNKMHCTNVKIKKNSTYHRFQYKYRYTIFFSKDAFRGTHYTTRLLLHDIIKLGL